MPFFVMFAGLIKRILISRSVHKSSLIWNIFDLLIITLLCLIEFPYLIDWTKRFRNHGLLGSNFLNINFIQLLKNNILLASSGIYKCRLKQRFHISGKRELSLNWLKGILDFVEYCIGFR